MHIGRVHCTQHAECNVVFRKFSAHSCRQYALLSHAHTHQLHIAPSSILAIDIDGRANHFITSVGYRVSPFFQYKLAIFFGAQVS